MHWYLTGTIDWKFADRRNDKEYELSEKDYRAQWIVTVIHRRLCGLHKYHPHIPLVLRCQNQTGPLSGFLNKLRSPWQPINHPVTIYFEESEEALCSAVKIQPDNLESHKSPTTHMSTRTFAFTLCALSMKGLRGSQQRALSVGTRNRIVHSNSSLQRGTSCAGIFGKNIPCWQFVGTKA